MKRFSKEGTEYEELTKSGVQGKTECKSMRSRASDVQKNNNEELDKYSN